MAEVPPPLIPSPVDVFTWFIDAVEAERAKIPANATRDEVLNGIKNSIGAGIGSIAGAETAIFNWVVAATRSVVSSLNMPDMAPVVARMTSEWEALRQALGIENMNAVWAELDTDWTNLLKLSPQLPFDVIAWMFTQMTGLTITGDQIRTLATASPTREDRIALGQILVTLYDETLPTERVAAGFLAREAGTAEWENFKMLSGAAMRLNIAGFVFEWIANKMPYSLGKFAKEITDVLNDAVALDDALEEVVQVPMQAVIQKGLESQYNRRILPNDFTDNQAIQAMIGYDFPVADMHRVMDNNGLRKDIRETLISMTATNLTESDINEAYQRNLLSIEQVKEQYKQKFFQEPERQIKTDLVKGTRRWQLQTKVVELLVNLYRDGVQTKDSCIPYLNALGFENDEQDLWFMQQELERKQRKWLSNAQIEDMLKHGLANVEWAIDYQVMQGMLPEDATLVYMSYLLDKYNKQLDEDCVQILKDAASPAKLIGFLLGKLPEFGIAGMFGKTELQKVLQCLLTNTKKAP